MAENASLNRIPDSTLFLKAIFDSISEEIMVIDATGTIHDVNKVFLDQCGLPREAVVGKKCYEIRALSGNPCHIDRYDCPMHRAKQNNERVEVIHRYRQPGALERELTRIMYPISTGAKDGPYFVEISTDVTEYRNLIRRLKAEKKRFSTILDTATDAVICIDKDHKIILFNAAAQRIFAYTGEEVLNRDLNLLIPPQYGNHYRLLNQFLETRSPPEMGADLKLTALRKGGEEFPVELGLSFYEIEGDITFTAIVKDISMQKQLEKKLLQSERLAAVGKTVAHVAHEIKNPLMIIGGFSHQIRDALTDEKSIQKLDMILEEVRRLERLVRSIGDFTKVHNLVSRMSNINSVLQDVVKIMQGFCSPEKHRFSVDLAPDLSEIICDPDKLKQVFINIITNGLEAMEEGGTIAITTQKAMDSVEIRISDEGVGIHEKDLLHIFEPFFTTRERGFGLGLAISYKLIEAHGGEMWADSVPGKGTTFVIRLPTGQ
ncbi:MAG: PAS domain S-box protein [Deltaproteobacteria bacterium]|nr:PAS domain S-box protein [Deltaproteobacteria bacterium]